MPRNGFTLAEMIMVLVVVGVLGAIGIPRMTGVSNLPSMTAADRLLSALQYAQVLAQRSGIATQVAISSAAPHLIVQQGSNPVFFPNDKYPGLYKVDFDAGVSVSGTTAAAAPLTSVNYDTSGIPTPAASYPACFSVHMGTLTYYIKVEVSGFSHSVSTCP